MPYSRVNQTLYVGGGGNPEAINTTTLYKPGELGGRIDYAGKSYQLIQVDSGATAATAAGVPIAGHLAFWKSRTNYIVTNDKAQAIGGPTATLARNAYAGVFNSLTSGAAGTTSITPGNFGCIQERGQHVGVKTDGGADFVINDMIVPSTNTAADGDRNAQGTAPPVNPVGRVTATEGSVTAGYTPCFLGGWDAVEVP